MERWGGPPIPTGLWVRWARCVPQAPSGGYAGQVADPAGTGCHTPPVDWSRND